MSAKPRPYDSFGHFILFKKLEHDGLGELWRAGTIEGNGIGSTVALRKLSGGNRAAMMRAAELARPVATSISGPTFVKHQSIDIFGEMPYLVHDYDGGRSLRYIVEKARGTGHAAPHPIPIEQALAIIEKVALSVETISNLKYGGVKLLHGALLPHFVWITDDGEVRTAGQQLGKGIPQSLRVPDFAAAVGGYVAPEVRDGSDPSRATDVFSLGALLFLVLTGHDPVDTADTAALEGAVTNAKLMGGEPVPADVKEILQHSYTGNVSARYSTAGEMRQAITSLFQSGKYAPTTFNLAFYLSTLLKKELEGEALDRERELRVNVLPYLETMTAPVPMATNPPAAFDRMPSGPIPAPRGATAPPQRSKLPLALGAAALIIGGSAAGYFFLMRSKPATAPSKVVAAQVMAPVPASIPLSQPIVAAAPAQPADTALTPGTATAAGVVDEAARKKALEEEINRRLQQEMLKLQAEYDRSVQQKRPAAQTPEPVERRASVAEPVRSQSLPQSAATQTSPPAPVAAETKTQPSIPAVSAPAPAAQAAITSTSPPAAAEPVAASVRDGDLIEYALIDRTPELTTAVRPVYPPLAARQKIEGTVILSALISETGRVLDVKVLRGDRKGMGLDEAAVRAIRNASFSPPMKDGKRVKTWKPIPIIFKLQ